MRRKKNGCNTLTETKMLNIIKLCAEDKAPGPDGFMMGFFKECWSILGEDLLQTIRNFHWNEFFEKYFNVTFIALIPKKNGAEELKEFGPINLRRGICKVISKLITERMKSVITKLVDDHQMAFLKGRQILDATLSANELVDSGTKIKKAGILWKLGIEKAYDHVN